MHVLHSQLLKRRRKLRSGDAAGEGVDRQDSKLQDMGSSKPMFFGCDYYDYDDEDDDDDNVRMYGGNGITSTRRRPTIPGRLNV